MVVAFVGIALVEVERSQINNYYTKVLVLAIFIRYSIIYQLRRNLIPYLEELVVL